MPFRFLSPPVLTALMFSASAGLPNSVAAQTLFERLGQETYLVDVQNGTKQSEKAESLSRGGYELADGTFVSFDTWYRTRWTEMRFDFMTQLHKNVGVLWGVSTGEVAKKYHIQPGLKIGLILQAEPTPRSSLSISVTHILGNRFIEKACVGDYPEFGGEQPVNCRLAASEMPTQETLKYLVRARPPDHSWVGLRYRLAF